jgi:hypothetical protein
MNNEFCMVMVRRGMEDRVCRYINSRVKSRYGDNSSILAQVPPVKQIDSYIHVFMDNNDENLALLHQIKRENRNILSILSAFFIDLVDKKVESFLISDLDK